MIDLIVVDDEEGVRRSLRKVLEKDGYNVLLAENGEQAINIVGNNGRAIETVISDYKMPGLNGLETLTAIGHLNPEITRIMLTGYATMESAIEAVNAGIDGFLTKPFENSELKAKVREYNLKKRLKQFVSDQIITELQREGNNIRPRRQMVSVIFSDIRGFSAMAETMEPEDLGDMLNHRYFSPLDNIIFEFNGTLDKHIGDNIMGVFGAPVAYEDDAIRAVMSALQMRETMEIMNEKAGGSGRQIGIGIGISTGVAMAGIFGSSRKKEYTVFGPPVNLASRLEGLAKVNQILICEDTYRLVQQRVRAEIVALPPIKGIERRLDVYSVLEAI
ncbi:MAG: response regulator [Deltaproteobacteria bacterium]|nr:response regulator [Deltaproteobacteria bacterium]